MGGSLGGSDTGFTVPGGLVGDGELSQVPSDHVKLDFDVVEALSVIDGNKVSNHFWHDNAVTQVGLDWSRFLSRLSVLFCFLAFEVEPVVFVFDFWG